jgi:hypothetical protein
MCHPAKADTGFYGTTQKGLQVFTSMNESVGAGNYSPWDAEFAASNPTPVYIQPYGDFPNSIAPAYPIVAGQDWIFAPPEDRIPEELKRSLQGQELQPNEDQKKQQEWNASTTYEEPTPTKGPDAVKPQEEPAPAAGGTQGGQAQPAPAEGAAQPAPAAAAPQQ